MQTETAKVAKAPKLVRDRRELLGKIKVTRQVASWLDTCVRCGLCADACHIYGTDPQPKHMPSYKAELFRRVHRRYNTWAGRHAPWLVGARDLTEDLLDEFKSLAYQCSMCRRCVMYCPFGVDNTVLVRSLRIMITAAGKAPRSLQEVTDTVLEKGNTLGISHEKYHERLQWFNEMLREETGDPKAELPVDKAGAEILFMPTPLQVMKFPSVILSVAKIFRAAGIDWTLSGRHFDATNFGLFIGDDGAAKTMAGRVMEEAERLQVKRLVITECGHAFRVAKIFAGGWLGKKFPFKIESILEVVADLIQSGRIKLDKSRNAERVTYHDPCQLARNSGVIEQPRVALHAAVADFREMEPNRNANWCCGGGGGLTAVTEPELVEVKMKSARPKAEQIRATGAKLVATACDNCKLQLIDIGNHYGLDFKVVGVVDLVANALVS